MAIYQVPEIMLICSSKHATSGTTAMIRLMFSWVSVIHFIFQYLLYFLFWVCGVFLFTFVVVCFYKQNWYIKQKYGDAYHSCIFRVMLISAVPLQWDIAFYSKEYGWSGFWDFLLALIVPLSQVKNLIYRMIPSSKYNHCTFGMHSGHKNDHWVSQQVWRTHYKLCMGQDPIYYLFLLISL